MDAMERLRGILTDAGIEPRGANMADVNAMCELYKLQTTGQQSPSVQTTNLHLAQAMREILEGWAIHMSCWIDLDDGGLKYEIKATETIPKELVGQFTLDEETGEHIPVRVPRTVGLAIRGPEPQTPIPLANSMLNIHFINAMNAILRQVHNVSGDLVAEDVPEETNA